MSRSLRKIGRNQNALKALVELSQAIPKLQGGVKGLVEALPRIEQTPETQKLIDALVEDVETVANEQEVIRETFLRLLIALSDDTEENIRKVEASIRETLLEERKGT